MTTPTPAEPSPASPTPRSDDIQTLDRIFAQIVDLHAQLGVVYALVGRHPGLYAQWQPKLDAMQAHRRELTTQLGEMVHKLHREGRRVKFVHGDAQEQVAGEELSPLAPPAPIEPVASPPPAPTPEAAPVMPEPRLLRLEPPRERPSQMTQPPASEAERKALQRLLSLIGPPRAVEQMVALLDELEALETLTSDDNFAIWPTLPRPWQRTLLAMAVARTRAIKDTGSLPPSIRDRVRRVISFFPTYAKSHGTGHVTGLSVAHVAERGTWREDAWHHWRQLIEMCERG